MSNEPITMGELTRRVDGLERRLDRTSDIYLRKEVYAADQRAEAARWVEHDKDLTEINTARATDTAFRRQVMLALAGLSITTLVTVALYVASILGGR